ncbi:MAG: ribosome biogenesis GTPase YlqF [Eubacteriales bacterium]|nr:ribosome biogenesis GTPase YlqF [Eubacteriales bacterium]MDD4389526.1 ribosome biogenesis GTPase YlqF [Eubacteriales bacterium]
MIENINWYPGHMKKTRELIEENLKLIDVVVEVIDARIPLSSRNPIIDEIVKRKSRIIVMNKSDLSDDGETAKWISHFGGRENAIEMNCMSGSGKKQLVARLDRLQEKKNEGQLRHKPLRIMIVGVPNVGKSSLINRLMGKKSAKIGDRPGVTRGKQWLVLENNMQLLDTPGILWPKFEDPQVGLNLAFCGSIRDEILDTSTLALELIQFLAKNYTEDLLKRYNLSEMPDEEELLDEDGMEISQGLALMNAISLKRGFILPGKKIDYERAGRTILDEFRAGLIGRITLESPEDLLR